MGEAMAAIRGSVKGASRMAIYNKLGELFPGMQMNLANKAIKSHMDDGNLQNGSTTARFKLTEKGREYLKDYKKSKKDSKKKKKKSKPRTPTKAKKKGSKKKTRGKKRTATKKKS